MTGQRVIADLPSGCRRGNPRDCLLARALGDNIAVRRAAWNAGEWWFRVEGDAEATLRVAAALDLQAGTNHATLPAKIGNVARAFDRQRKFQEYADDYLGR